MFTILVDAIEEPDMISGRVGELNIPIGTIFTRIRKYTFDKNSNVDLQAADAGVAGQVNLKLEEAWSYKRKMENAPSKWATRIKVCGQGVDLIRELIALQKENECYELEADEV